MSRLGFIARHPKRALSGLATLLVASGLVVGSGAFFQATDTNDGSSVSTGTVAIAAFGGDDAANALGRKQDARDCGSQREASKPQPLADGGNFDGCYASPDTSHVTVAKGAIFDITNLEPGQVVEKQAKLSNTGSLDVNTYLRLIGHDGNNDLFNALEIRVDNITKGFANIYQGPLSGLAAAWNKADLVQPGIGDPPAILAHDATDQYRFQIKLPETGQNQNLVMGKETSFQVQWLARDQGAPAPTV